MIRKIENGIYYEDGTPIHRGVVKLDGTLYYAGHDGKIVAGRQKAVHGTMTNGLVKRGLYEFDDEGRLIKSSYVAPEKKKKSSNQRDTRPRGMFVLVFALIVFAVALLLLLLKPVLFKSREKDSPTEEVLVETHTPVFVPPVFDDDVYLCSRAMEKYYKGEISLAEVTSSKSSPYAPLSFKYQLYRGCAATLEIDGRSYELDPNGTSVEIDNLMTGKTYDYTVTVTEIYNTVPIKSVYTGSFRTADTNRFVSIPGVENTRDIGTYRTESGKTVRQGLLIRGTEIDGLVESKFLLTDPTAVEPFGFKYDFDLRLYTIYSAEYKSLLGDGVKHKFYSAPAYGEIFYDKSRERLREIFSDLADPANYPMYMHCTYGADRAGTIVFLLQGILGVSDDDKSFEYELTGAMMSDFELGTHLNGIYGGLDAYAGATVNEKIVDFLKNTVGVTDAHNS